MGFNVVNSTCDCSNRNVVREEKGENPLICIWNSNFNSAVNPCATTRKKRTNQRKENECEKKNNQTFSAFNLNLIFI